MRTAPAFRALALLLCALLGAPASPAAAQDDGRLTYALRVGAGLVSVSGVGATFCPADGRQACSVDVSGHVEPEASVTVHYRFPTSLVAVEGGLGYVRTRCDAEVASATRSESYTLAMNHVLLSAGARVYPVGGAYVGAALGAGPCLNGTSCVTYESAGLTNTARMQVEDHVRQAVKGRMLVRAALTLGCDLPCGLALAASYSRGLTDLLEVGVNDYGYAERRNDAQYAGLSVGWLLTSEGFKRRR